MRLAAPAFVGVALVGSIQVRPHLNVSSCVRKDSMHHRLDLIAQVDSNPATAWFKATKSLRGVSPRRFPTGWIAAKSFVLIEGAQDIRRGSPASGRGVCAVGRYEHEPDDGHKVPRTNHSRAMLVM